MRYGHSSRVFQNSSLRTLSMRSKNPNTKQNWHGVKPFAVSCPSPVPPTGSSLPSVKGSIEDLNGPSWVEQPTIAALCSCVRDHPYEDCRLMRLEKLVQELRMQMQKLHSDKFGGSTPRTDSSVSTVSTSLSSTKSQKRKKRRRKLEALRKAAAEQMLGDTTLRDSLNGSKTKSPSVSGQRSCELGQSKADETEQRSWIDAINPHVRGFIPRCPPEEMAPKPHPAPTHTQINKEFLNNWRRIYGQYWNDLDGVYNLQRLFADPPVPPRRFRAYNIGRFFDWACDNGSHEDLSSLGSSWDEPEEVAIREHMYEAMSESSIEVIHVDAEDPEVILRELLYAGYAAEGFVPDDDCHVDNVSVSKEVVEDKGPNKWSARFKKWHDRWFKTRDVNLDEALHDSVMFDQGSFHVVSETDVGRRWHVTKTKEGDALCTLEDIPSANTNAPDMSNLGVPFDQDETRPSKVLVLSRFMKKRGLPYVDVGLFYHLKNACLNTVPSCPHI